MGRILAAADVGSNTTHLLIAETDGMRVSRIENESVWISLGEVVSRTGGIPPERADTLERTLRQFVELSRARKATRMYVFGTEALRSAGNGEEVLKRISRATGVQIDVINGRREAELSIRGAALDSKPAMPALYVEIGGGSAQVAISDGTTLLSEFSLPLGTGRLIAQSGLTQPATEAQIAKLHSLIDASLDRLPASMTFESAVCSGGVGRGLWRALHPDGERTLLLDELKYIFWASSRLATDRITQRFRVKERRGSTLAPGSLVLIKLFERLGIQEIKISEYGVREGAVLEMYDGRIHGWPL